MPVRLKQSNTDIGGWIEMLAERNLEEFYLSRIKNLGNKSKSVQDMDIKGFDTYENRSIDTDESDSVTEKKVKDEKAFKKKLETRIESSGSLSERSIMDCLDDEARAMLRSIQGVIIRNNRICSGRGGITVCRMAQGWVEGNVMYDLVYGVRCVQSSKLGLLNNKIYSCETSAVIMREHSTGLIAGNQIYGNNEAGIDLRNGANPIIQHNEVHSGRRSGVVCLDNGKGLIRDNDIYNNKEAGVYILYKGNPVVK